jgi:predicted DNA-binding transcriptional regulator AlpA
VPQLNPTAANPVPNGGAPDAGPVALPPLLVRRREAARLCGLSPASWDRLACSGRTPGPIRLGSAVLWSVEELRVWVEAGCPPRAEWEALQKQKRADPATRR